jgi:hypothetical protein
MSGPILHNFHSKVVVQFHGASIGDKGDKGDQTPEFRPQVTSLLYVDKNRTDTYTPDGSILRPFKGLEAAMLAASGATELNRFAIVVFPGRYTLTATLVLRAFVDICGIAPNASANPVYIEFAGEVLTAPTSMNLGGVCLANLLIVCLSDTPTDWAVRIQTRGNVFFQNVCVFSNANGVVLEGDSVGVSAFLGVSSVGDALKVQGTSFLALEHGMISGGGGESAHDLIVEANATVYVDSSTWFQNDALAISGTMFCTSVDSQTRNTSNVEGATTKDALNTLASIPDPRSLPDGNYVLHVAGGAASWTPYT